MRPISPRPIFTLPFFTAATKTFHFAAFSTQTTTRHHHQRWNEEESRGVRVSVWWDFENCQVPVNANAFKVAQCITNAIRANGIKGPIEITAFGDVMQVSRTNQEALSATGINLTHVPSGGKNSADRSLLVDLMYWVSKNPPPAHLFLISGDRDFAGILHRLRMSNYNILLASPDSAPNVLCSAATIMWQWSSLLKGQNLTGKLFNQPPDGPYSSWYGYYKAPVEDPFAFAEQSSCPSADESSLLAPEPKLRPIPKAVRNHISRILRSYPEGVSVIQLRNELTKSIDLDKDLFGYKKFTHFLLAMPHTLKLHEDAGNILVQCVNTKSPDELVPAADEKPETNNGQYIKKSSCENVTEKSTVGSVLELKVKAELSKLQEAPKEENPSNSFLSMKMQDARTETHANVEMEIHAAHLQDLEKEENRRVPLPKINVQENKNLKLKNQTLKAELSKLQEAPKEENPSNSFRSMKMQDARTETHADVETEIHAAHLQDLEKEENRRVPLPKINVQEIQENKNLKLKNQTLKEEVVPPVVKKNESKTLVPDDRSSAFGYGMFRRIWMKLFGSRDSERNVASSSGKDVVAQKTLAPCLSSEPVRAALFSPSSHEALINGKTAWSGDPASDISSQHSSFSNQSSSWFKFWRSSTLDNKVGKNGEMVDCLIDTKQHDENEVENDCKAARVDAKSKQIAIFSKESFWKEIESFIDSSKGLTLFSRSRTRGHLVQNLQKQGPPVLRSLSENELLHLIDLLISDKKWVEVRDFQRYPFRCTHSTEKCPENNCPSGSNGLSLIFSAGKCPGNNKNHPHTEVLNKGSSIKPRNELLTDCQKLVDEIVKEYPEGFNIGGFRKLFLEKYGYALDLHKVGHGKLLNFLKTMSGATVEANLILPAGALKNLDQQNTGHPIQESEVDRVVDLHGDSPIISKEDDESDTWDELGPVDTSGSEKDETETNVSEKSRKGTEQRLPYYEPLREDDFSDSEEETSYTNSESEGKPKLMEESVLLDILESWHNQKEDDSQRDESMGKTNMNRVESGSELSSTPSSKTKTESEVVKTTRKQKSHKSYSFVKDQSVDSKDKLIDGILGSLKKSSDNSSDSQVLS